MRLSFELLKPLGWILLVISAILLLEGFTHEKGDFGSLSTNRTNSSHRNLQSENPLPHQPHAEAPQILDVLFPIVNHKNLEFKSKHKVEDIEEGEADDYSHSENAALIQEVEDFEDISEKNRLSKGNLPSNITVPHVLEHYDTKANKVNPDIQIQKPRINKKPTILFPRNSRKEQLKEYLKDKEIKEMIEDEMYVRKIQNQ